MREREKEREREGRDREKKRRVGGTREDRERQTDRRGV